MDTDENGDVNIEKAEFYFASGMKWNFADESDDEEEEEEKDSHH